MLVSTLEGDHKDLTACRRDGDQTKGRREGGKKGREGGRENKDMEREEGRGLIIGGIEVEGKRRGGNGKDHVDNVSQARLEFQTRFARGMRIEERMMKSAKKVTKRK